MNVARENKVRSTGSSSKSRRLICVDGWDKFIDAGVVLIERELESNKLRSSVFI